MTTQRGEALAMRHVWALIASIAAGLLAAWTDVRVLAAEGVEPAQPAKAPAGAAAPGDDGSKRVGRTIRVRLPISGPTTSQVRRFVLNSLDDVRSTGVRPVLIFEFVVPPDQKEFARTTEFGVAYDLANFISSEKVNEATTVAYIPQTVEGHAVLVALACDEIIMAPEAEIGSAGVNERTITPAMLSFYKEIAGRRKSIPPEVALGLLDVSREVLEVETDLSREYVTPEGLEELRKQRTIQSSRVLFQAGQPGRLSGNEARELGFISYKAEDLRDVARALELPPGAVEEDPSLGEAWRAVRIDVSGPIDAEKVTRAERMIADAVNKRDVNFICLWIDSPGGSPADSLRLAGTLAYDLDPGEVRTVAYIPKQARSDAALIALACDQVVMHPDAILGGEGDGTFADEQVHQAKETIRKGISARKMRSWSLPAAMIDPNLEVYRYSRLGSIKHDEYFSEEELSQQPNRDEWKQGEKVTRPGEPFSVRGEEAIDYWLATHVVDNFAAFRAIYELEDDPALMEPSWADTLIEALASPGLAVLLLIVGFAALYAELQMPGIGLGGFIAALCFLLFFWSRFLGGTAGWLEVILFITGVSCLLLEIFVLPGFGVFGLGGGLLVILSLVLASQTFIVPRNAYQFGELQQSLLIIGGALVGTIAAGALMHRWLPRAPILGEVMLEPPAGEEARDRSRRESLVSYEHLLGAQGETVTQLMPSGKARFGDRVYDVISDGDVIPRAAAVRVVEVHGNRILVQSAETTN